MIIFFLNLAYQAKIYATFHQEKLLSRRGQKGIYSDPYAITCVSLW